MKINEFQIKEKEETRKAKQIPKRRKRRKEESEVKKGGRQKIKVSDVIKIMMTFYL